MARLKAALGVLLAMLLVGAGLVAAIGGGFLLTGAVVPGLGRMVAMAVILALAAAAGLGWHIRSYRGEPAPQLRPLWRRRVVARQPVPTIAQAAYAADRRRLATCAHLHPIESDMRASGIEVRLMWGSTVKAGCVIDPARLARRYGIAPPMFYTDSFPGDRPGDPESALIVCHEHGASILVIHPLDAGAGTASFPP